MNERQSRVLKKLKEIQRVDGLTTRHLEEIMASADSLERVDADLLPRRFPAVTPEAIDSWLRFERDQPLSARDLFHLESIILPDGARPAFDVLNDSFDTLPSLWQGLNDQRSLLEPIIRGIGRLDLVGHPATRIAGTAFVCGPRRLMTNRHVAEIFTQGVGTGMQLRFSPGITAFIDFKQEVGSSASVVVDITAPLLILEEWDIAVLEISALPLGAAPLPMANTPPSQLLDRLAAVVGYPSFDPGESLRQQREIFRNQFDKKRLQPGRLKGFTAAPSFGRQVQALAHDCTTLGGNSGSAVIDVDSSKVFGIHFDGQPFVANFAVPTWELAADARIRGAGVEF
ncbi:MAG: glutamyl endopeptidase [Acidobacteriota bacterium]|nr:glutamyl endopeptidase [Acidobacteriota bacterium]